MMRKSGGWQPIAVHDGFKVLMLPYQAPVVAARVVERTKKGDPVPQYHMCVFLPDARDGLWSLVDEMASSGPDFLHDHLPTEEVGLGRLRLPRAPAPALHSAMAMAAKKIVCCKEEGVKRIRVERLRAFMTPDLEEGFGEAKEMAEAKAAPVASWMAVGSATDEDDGSGLPLVVQDVFHKAVIEVNEEGTEAAAVTYTGLIIGASCPPRVTVDFVADHPLFFIVEKVSSAVVFAGYVLDPTL
ncbi:hypothetical protein EJB05_44698, partial [Eragrostis curvula]